MTAQNARLEKAVGVLREIAADLCEERGMGAKAIGAKYTKFF